MRGEDEKGEIELAVFREFARKASLVLLGEPEKQTLQKKPDVLCKLEEGHVYFELTEACAPEFAAAVTESVKNDSVVFRWGNDISELTLANKLRKSYEVSEPIELILYTAGRTALPDDVITSKVSGILANDLGPFRRIWLLGDTVKLLASNAS